MDGHPTAVFNPVYKSFKFKDFDSTKGLEVEQEACLKHDNLFTSKFRSQDIEVITHPHPDDSRNIYVVRKASRGSDYLEWKDSIDSHSHSLRKDSMDYDLPEFVAFLQESGNCRYFKDIVIDKEVPCEDNCSVQNFKLDHNYISCILNSDPDSDSESMGEAFESDSSTSTEDDCNKKVTKQRGSKHSKIDGEKYFGQVDYDLSVDRSIKTTISETLLPVRQGSSKAIWTNSTVKSDMENANKVSRHFNTPMTTMNGREEVPQSEERHPSEVGNMSTPSTEDGTSEMSTEAGQIHKQNPSFGSISLRSNGSTASSESFAFPILAPEWNGSPARMTNDGDQRELSRHGSHRHLGWGMRFLCCKF